MTGNKRRYVQVFIGLLYLFGWLGMTWPSTRSLFIAATPWTLLLGSVFLAIFHKQESRYQPGIYVLVLITSLLIEWWGVQTGLVFGGYYYGEALGFKVMDIPLMIGLNWLMLIYMFYAVIQRWQFSPLMKSIIGAAMMVGYDLALERVAPSLDYWYWFEGQAPFQNYLLWWVLSFMYFMIWEKSGLRYQNSIAFTLLIAQILFFALLNLTL